MKNSALSFVLSFVPPLALLTLLGGCAVGSDYQRPDLVMPAGYRTSDSQARPHLETSLGNTHWQHVFPDPVLHALIEEALKNNLDLQVAEARLREAQANITAVRAGLLPNVSLGLNTSPVAKQEGDKLSSSFLGAGLLSWELDLWGKIRRRTEAAQADAASRLAIRHAAQVSLIAEVVVTHSQIIALRDTLSMTERITQLQRDALRLMQRRNSAGIVSSAEVRQAESQLATTEALLPSLRQKIASSENALAVLLGKAPEAAGTARANLVLPETLPAGLPSELVERRPDLIAAEQQLIAANARVGEAKAQFFPSISLTGTFGRVSTSLSDVLQNNGSAVSSLGLNVLQPLFAGNALIANHQAAQARLEQALLSYRQSVLKALAEVSDAIISYEYSGATLAKQTVRVHAARETLRLANKRFDAGVISYLEVLDAQRQLLAAETDEINSRLTRQVGWVKVYRALGGGWPSPQP